MIKYLVQSKSDSEQIPAQAYLGFKLRKQPLSSRHNDVCKFQSDQKQASASQTNPETNNTQ